MNDIFLEGIIKPVTELLVGLGWKQPKEYQVTLILVISFFLLEKLLVAYVPRVANYISTLRSFKKLEGFWNEKQIREYTKNYIKPRLHMISPNEVEEINPKEGEFKPFTTDGISFFKKEIFNADSDQKFYIVLGGSGLGKSAFSINLYVSYNRNFKSFLKGRRIEVISLSSHLAADNKIKELVRRKKEKNTILILDALDEDELARVDFEKRINELGQMTQNFVKVVFTARTQFFPSEEEEPQELKIKINGPNKGLHTVRRYYLSPFFEDDIQLYLDKKYGRFFPFRRTRAKNDAKRIVSFSEKLMVRPFLLSYIDDLVKGENYVYEYQVYNTLIDKWVQREAEYVDRKHKEQYKKTLHEFSIKLARNLYENSYERNGFHIEEEDLVEFNQAYGIDLSSLDARSKSLLNRNHKYYKFAHKSIFEFLLAKACILDENFNDFLKYENLKDAAKYYKQLSEVEVVMDFFRVEKIAIYNRTPAGKGKKSLTTIELNHSQFEKLTGKLGVSQFKSGFDEMKIQNIFITGEGTYDWKKLERVYSLQMISYYKSLVNKVNFAEAKESLEDITLSSDYLNYSED